MLFDATAEILRAWHTFTPCPHRAFGCPHSPNTFSLRTHALECTFRPHTCLDRACGWKQQRSDDFNFATASHLFETHDVPQRQARHHQIVEEVLVLDHDRSLWHVTICCPTGDSYIVAVYRDPASRQYSVMAGALDCDQPSYVVALECRTQTRDCAFYSEAEHIHCLPTAKLVQLRTAGTLQEGPKDDQGCLKLSIAIMPKPTERVS